MPQAVAQRLLNEFGLTFAEGYGLTETAAPSHSQSGGTSQAAVPGHPVSSAPTARVVDPITLRRNCRSARPAKSSCTDRMVFKGYWRHPASHGRQPSSSCPTDPPGVKFFRTGDLGRMDEEGYFFITDRLKRMINASGYKVWPSGGGDFCSSSARLVQEACIISRQGRVPRRDGQGRRSCCAPRRRARRASPRTSLTWAREHMAAYKVPKIVRVRRRNCPSRARAR